MVKKTKVVLSFEANNKVVAFVELLIKVDKHMLKANNDNKAKNVKPSKVRKSKKDDDIGSLFREPFLLGIFYC